MNTRHAHHGPAGITIWRSNSSTGRTGILCRKDWSETRLTPLVSVRAIHGDGPHAELPAISSPDSSEPFADLRHLEIRLPVSGLERCPGCHPELPFTSHKQGIDETWRSEFQTAAKDLAAHEARPFAALRVTGIISKY